MISLKQYRTTKYKLREKLNKLEWIRTLGNIARYNRKFKKLRRLPRQNRRNQIQLCVKISVLRLFHVGYVVQNRWSALSLARHEWFSCREQEWLKDLLVRARVVVRTSNTKISLRHFADYVKNLQQKACRTCSTIIFLHSTNKIIDFWCCRYSYRHHFLNSLIYNDNDDENDDDNDNDDHDEKDKT